jgi:hypothetical protein
MAMNRRNGMISHALTACSAGYCIGCKDGALKPIAISARTRYTVHNPVYKTIRCAEVCCTIAMCASSVCRATQ